MKLQQIFSDVVHKYWDPLIRSTVSRTNPGSEAAILKALLMGQAQCWLAYEEEEDDVRKVVAVAITSVMEDGILELKNLLVYHLYAFTDVKTEDWIEGINHLRLYGKGRGCQNLVAYSDNPRIEKLFLRAGGEAQYKFLRLEIAE